LGEAMRRFQARLSENLERELARCRRTEDEAARTVAGMREDINLLRKQAMVLNDDFLRVRCSPADSLVALAHAPLAALVHLRCRVLDAPSCMQRSNELDRAKMTLAIQLEQANMVVHAKAHLQDALEEMRREDAADKEVRGVTVEQP